MVGGYAVIHYGHVRATGDLDIFVKPTLENSSRILAALNDFGWSDPALESDYFAQPGNTYIMGRPPVRIDLIARIDGPDFDVVYRDRVVVGVEGQSVAFISLEHLRANKLASGRNKDLGDLDALFETRDGLKMFLARLESRNIVQHVFPAIRPRRYSRSGSRLGWVVLVG